MSERAGFISAILDNPDDDTARLVFADWLEEHGEVERAEFVRCQIEAARLPESHRDVSEPAKRATELLKQHEAEWRKVVPEKRDDYFLHYGGEAPGRYKRGFLEDIGVYAPEFLHFAGPLLAVEPATVALFMKILHADRKTIVTIEETECLAASPCLRAVEELFCVAEDHFARLMQSPHLVNVHTISFINCSTDAEDIRILAAAPALSRLERLFLSLTGDPQDATEAVGILAISPQFRSLKYLDLYKNQIGNEHIEMLLASTTLPRSLHIELGNNNFDKERFAEVLAERFTGGSDKEGE